MREVSVAVGRLARQGRSVCGVAEDVRGAGRSWRACLDSPSRSFELRDATEAVIAVCEAWEDEFGVYRQVLQEWCRATQAAAAGYQTVDEYMAAQFPRPGRPF